MDVQVKYI